MKEVREQFHVGAGDTHNVFVTREYVRVFESVLEGNSEKKKRNFANSTSLQLYNFRQRGEWEVDRDSGDDDDSCDILQRQEICWWFFWASASFRRFYINFRPFKLVYGIIRLI